ncbi:MAG TPA: hypothetical protein VMS14_04145 [Ilumatobacteraceae bacterium]|nr:hypothetical protein [Ilumatobacteraceae bacterium]
MMYTLTTWALWLVAAAAVGLVVGWLLGRLRPESTEAGGGAPYGEPDDADQAADVGDATPPPAPVPTPVTVTVVDSALEAEHYAALSQLEQVTAERDELRRELRKRRSEPVAASVAPAAGPSADTAPSPANGDAERLASELRVRLWNAEATITELRERLRTAEGEGTGA